MKASIFLVLAVSALACGEALSVPEHIVKRVREDAEGIEPMTEHMRRKRSTCSDNDVGDDPAISDDPEDPPPSTEDLLQLSNLFASLSTKSMTVAKYILQGLGGQKQDPVLRTGKEEIANDFTVVARILIFWTLIENNYIHLVDESDIVPSDLITLPEISQAKPSYPPEMTLLPEMKPIYPPEVNTLLELAQIKPIHTPDMFTLPDIAQIKPVYPQDASTQPEGKPVYPPMMEPEQRDYLHGQRSRAYKRKSRGSGSGSGSIIKHILEPLKRTISVRNSASNVASNYGSRSSGSHVRYAP